MKSDCTEGSCERLFYLSERERERERESDLARSIF
jgi:hypothetical protein